MNLNKTFTVLVLMIFVVSFVSADVSPEKCHDTRVKVKIINGEEVVEYKIHKNSCAFDLPLIK